MTRIPKAIYEGCILLGLDIHDGKISAKTALALATELGSNPTSANDTFRAIHYMGLGKRYLRGLSAAATDFALDRFHSREDQGQFENALLAVAAHIQHDEKGGSAQLHSLRAILAKYTALRAASATLAAHLAREASAVARSIARTPADRTARLGLADPIPKTATVTATVYLRNPDVVATVLLRAGGICEGCLAPAPFLRRTDHSPYLEVHHRTPLAEGGPDTVANAIALCPNCHRRAHHGNPTL